jgi:hypothetical protein
MTLTNAAKAESHRREDDHIYDWPRFWVPATGTINLSDGGFLLDPTDLVLRSHVSWPAPLANLGSYRALALLGEPGIGKSTTLKAEAERIAAQPAEANAVSIYVDLRAYSSDVLLLQRVFESEKFKAWKNGTSHLFLHLDSLDEALLRVETIANLLANELPNYPTARMSVRIACRTAVWPASTLGYALHTIWGEEASGVFELAPLRRKDVAEAAKTYQIEPDAFVRELYAANAVPFAIKPLTLKMLLNLYHQDGCLPSSSRELYIHGCLNLCEEQSRSRRDTRRLGRLNPKQRLRLAGRVAAATMFGNRYAIWTGPEVGGVPPEDVPLSALSGGCEQGTFTAFGVTDDDVREVLDTGLFSSRGGARMGWAHQSYAEFLAALYLVEKNVASANILKILLHPAGGLVPQLSTIAAWAASLDSTVRAGLIASEPLVLLQGDLVNWNADDLAALTTSLLDAYEQKRCHDSILGIADAYAKLGHPGLAGQLRPVILDGTKNLITRRAAITIAEMCELKELQPELLHVALDIAENPATRARAVSALNRCGDDSVPAQMLPLARGECGPDPQDDIKGQALDILWPRYIGAHDLFALITHPNEGYYGAYALFLSILPETLTVGDLLPALQWATGFIAQVGYTGSFKENTLADAILFRTWRAFEEPSLTRPFVEHVFARLRQHGDLCRGTDYRARDAFLKELKDDVARRHKFLLAACTYPIERIATFSYLRAGILMPTDLEWLLEISPGGTAPAEGLNSDTLCNLIETAFINESPEHFEALYTTALRWPLLWARYATVFEGVSLDSAEVARARDQQRQLRELKKGIPPPLVANPPKQVVARLEQFEAGQPDAWWQLNMDLTLTPTSRQPGSDLDYIITKMPGWIDADATVRQRILAAAARYLTVGVTSVKEWLGKQPMPVFRNDFAAFRAFILLKQVAPEVYARIPAAAWQKWTPVIVGLPRETGTEGLPAVMAILTDALAVAPAEFVGAVRAIIRAERDCTIAEGAKADAAPGTAFFILRRLDGCWDCLALKEAVFQELKSGDNSPEQFVALLDALLAAGFDPARNYAIGLLAEQDALVGRYSLVAAEVLAGRCAAHAWPALWKLIVSDDTFARTLFLRIASHYRFDTPFYAGVGEAELADLYIFLERLFPRDSDPVHESGQVHWVGPQESVAALRDNIPRYLVGLGTVAAVQALRRIIAALPNLVWLPFELSNAEQVMRTKTWLPLTLKEVFSLTDRPSTQMVTSPDDLREALVAALRNYEAELHGAQNPVRGLWDRQAGGNTFRPIEEDGLSDDVKLFLERELVTNSIITNREVEISRVPGAPIGQRTDIRIDALRRSEDGTAFDVITAVIETKGCWNAELFTALETQLYRDYMVRLQAPVGIYLVGWFDKPKWDPRDARRRRTPNCTLLEAQVRLDAQAQAIPAEFSVQAIILDCHAP